MAALGFCAWRLRDDCVRVCTHACARCRFRHVYSRMKLFAAKSWLFISHEASKHVCLVACVYGNHARCGQLQRHKSRWWTSLLTTIGGSSTQIWLLLESKNEKKHFPSPEDNHLSSDMITWHVNKLKVDIVSMQTKSLKLINCTNLKQNNHRF